MDDPAIAAADHLHALSALGRINACSRTAARLAEGVVRVAGAAPASGTLVVVDVASGGGDVTVDVARRLTTSCRWQGVEVIGVDMSPRAIERSRRLAARRQSSATFALCDVTAAGCPPCDVAVSSLFLHHLDDPEAIRLLRSMAAAARRGIVVSDLIRSRLGLVFATVGTTILSRSRIARVDGPLSVHAARTPEEYLALFTRAGLHAATVRRVWPERVLVEWRAGRGAP
jgi:2-polyprenyl-3-methyl-5-hydroxy-6-metoxy-1,4-benzoquinol methylase